MFSIKAFNPEDLNLQQHLVMTKIAHLNALRVATTANECLWNMKRKFYIFHTRSDSQTFSLALWETKAHYCIYKNSTLFPILSHINPVHTHIHFNIFLPSMPMSPPYLSHATTIFLTEVNNTYINKYIHKLDNQITWLPKWRLPTFLFRWEYCCCRRCVCHATFQTFVKFWQKRFITTCTFQMFAYVTFSPWLCISTKKKVTPPPPSISISLFLIPKLCK